MSGKGGAAASGAGGSGAEGSPMMLRLSGGADEPKLVAGVENELDDGRLRRLILWEERRSDNGCSLRRRWRRCELHRRSR